MIDLIRKKRNGQSLTAPEMAYIANGAADGSIAVDQLAAWLMAAWIQGLSRAETSAMTLAMRDSGEKYDPASRASLPSTSIPREASATRPVFWWLL